MAVFEEQSSARPAFYVSRDYAPNGTTVRAIVGFRCRNNVLVPLRVRVTYGPQGSEIDWWAALGRPSSVIQPGEEISASGFSISAGQNDAFAVSIGQA